MSLSLKTIYVLIAGAVLPLAGQVPPNVPAQYQAIYSNLTTQIGAFQTAVNQNWNGKPYPVTWAPHLNNAESDNYLNLLAPYYYSNTVLTELLELQATGAKAVTVHINFPILYQPFYTYTNNPTGYAQFVAFYQQLASDIHARGMKMIVEATVAEALDGTEGAQFDPYYQTLDWNDYMSARAQNAVNVAQLIKPDYFSLICEPDSEAANASQPTEDSPAGALQLLQTILGALQQAGVTNMSIGAGAGSWIPSFTSYLQEFAALPLNYIDIHVYPVNDNDFMNVLTGMALIQSSGKAIGVSEAWPEKIADSELGTLNISAFDSRYVFSFWAPIDTAFLQAMVDCTQYEKVAFFSPSFPGYFAAYLDYNLVSGDTPAQLLPAGFQASAVANHAGAFTSTGSAFSTMISGVDKIAPIIPGAPTALNYTSTTASVTWTPTTDNVGVAGYNVYRNGLLATQLAIPPFYDTGLTPGATYTYYLTAFDAQLNVSAPSPTLSVTTVNTTPPTAPTNLSVKSMTQTSVSLGWSPSTVIGGVSGYVVYRGTTPSSMTALADVTTTSYVDTLANAAMTYYYAVEAYNASWVYSPFSPTIKVTTPAIPSPAGLKATIVSQNSVSMSWSALQVGAVTGYRVYRGTSPSGLTILGGATTSSYTDALAMPSNTYYYAVLAYNANGTVSALSAAISVTTPAIPSPAGLKITSVLQNSVSLAWSPSLIGGVTGYRVLKGTSAAAMNVVAGVTTPSYVDPYAYPSTTYFYSVEAYNVVGTASAPCAPVSTTTLALLPPTDLLAGSITNTSVSLSWNASGGADKPVGYVILKGTTPSSLHIMVADNPGTTYVDTLVAPKTTYYYQTEMRDSLGFKSLPSNTLTVVTP